MLAPLTLTLPLPLTTVAPVGSVEAAPAAARLGRGATPVNAAAPAPGKPCARQASAASAGATPIDALASLRPPSPDADLRVVATVSATATQKPSERLKTSRCECLFMMGRRRIRIAG